MDLVDLRLFSNVGETKSLTRAAERLHMSVPAASARIKNLEESISAKLLYRTSQGVMLTASGKIFLRYSQSMLSQFDNLRAELNDHAQGVGGRLRVHINKSAREFLPDALGTYLSAHPAVSVDLHESTGDEIVRAVKEGKADIGILAKEPEDEGLTVLPYRKDRFVLAAAPGHPLASRRSVRFEETLDYEYVGGQENTLVYKSLLEVASAMNKTFKIRVHVHGFETIFRLIEANIGIGILPEIPARRYAQNNTIRIIELKDEWAVRHWQICVRSMEGLPGFARELVELLVAGSAEFQH